MTSTDTQAPASEASPASSAAVPPQEAPAAPAPPERRGAPQKRGGGLLRMAVLVFTVLAAAFAGAAIARYALPSLNIDVAGTGAQQLQEEVADLTARLDSLDPAAMRARLAALEESGGASRPELTDLIQRLAAAEQATRALSASIAELQERPALTVPGGISISQESLDNLNATASSLKTQIADLTSRLDVAETALRGANSALNNRLTALEQKVPANIADQLANITSKTDVEALDKRIAMLESSTTALDAKRAAAAIALANLARAAGSGAPFAQELAAVRFLEVDQALLSPLAAYADEGVKPASELIAEYDAAARDALRAERGSTGDWWSRLWANISSLFLVRRTGPMEGNSAEAILSRAGDAVARGDLRGASGELSKLSGPAAAAIDEWRQAAEARTDLDRLVTGLTGALIATLNSQAPQ